ncbi:diaminopimelate decarboxylase [Scopulibacillus darangshiensis]|uniref:Diaminopimelate decarboxylase n=1 Tax=Scopulibacillus darangshiensis TaxID=442528 RepID=A0A4R2P9J4_9BACL|nr:diaminopimelate decarboxylase [Scopulibacillus darangshiensis]TCP31720.1 diaminopimelate decarboxylase [Scopulibacillus darangshiensis]
MRGTQCINQKGHLTIGGVDTVDLAKKYGTPLFVYDTALIREKAEAFKKAFETYPHIKWQVAYASKAFSSVAMVQLIHQLDLSLDVVSGGELFTAVKAGFPAERIHFHGNNKTEEELIFALDEQIGMIIVDNFYEIQLLEKLCMERGRTIDILLRLTPGIEAHTHDYIMTGQEDSKFGFNLGDHSIDEAIQLTSASNYLKLNGLHCHIGSQIFETDGFELAIKRIYQYIENWSEKYDFEPRVLNVGGGFGIKYSKDDQPIPLKRYIDVIVNTITNESEAKGCAIPEIWVEPGRAIVGEAGTTLYSIGAYKDIPNVKKYLAVDGGMTDNLRPSLYQAKYDAVVANRANEELEETVTVAGKCCESGDILIQDAQLSKSVSGDILAVFCTGAYGYSMANHYNRLPKPAVVFVEEGDAQLTMRRETYEDLVRQDIMLQEIAKAGY